MNATNPRSKDRTWLVPAIDVAERDGDWRVTVDLPGVTREDVALEFAQDRLTLFAPRHDQPTVGWRRSFRVPPHVDADRLEASLRDGVLTLTLPRGEAHRPRRIAVT